MKVIIFNVEHGFCAFVRSPNGYGIMIDCGRTGSFSPVEYILKHEADSLASFVSGLRSYKLSKLIISHPHDDHVEDIKNIRDKMPPGILVRKSGFNWGELKRPGAPGDYENLDTYVEWQSTYNTPIHDLDWGGLSLRVGPSLSIEEAKALGEVDFVNNTSIPVFMEYAGLKFVFPGDLMESGWRKLLENQDFCANLAGTKVFIASHHGHTSGFSSDVFDKMGKPDICIISAHKRDESVDSRYSSPDYINGIELGGEKRYRLTTRFDGTVVFSYVGNQSWRVDLLNLKD